MTCVLVTGATGLLGGRIAEWLSDGDDTKILRASRRKLPGFIQMDPENEPELEAVLSGVDWVINAAGLNAAESAQNPELAHSVNGDLAGRLATIGTRCGVSKFVQLSTVHVYGSPLSGELSESSGIDNPHPYATSNRLGEIAVLDITEGTDCSPIILRISNGFGAPIHPDANCWMLVLNEVARQIAETGSARLMSSGSQQRDFVPISHVCRSISALLNEDTEGIFNLGSGRSASVVDKVRQFLEIVRSELGRDTPLLNPEKSTAPADTFRIDTASIIAQTGLQVTEDCEHGEMLRLWRFCWENFGAENDA